MNEVQIDALVTNVFESYLEASGYSPPDPIRALFLFSFTDHCGVLTLNKPGLGTFNFCSSLMKSLAGDTTSKFFANVDDEGSGDDIDVGEEPVAVLQQVGGETSPTAVRSDFTSPEWVLFVRAVLCLPRPFMFVVVVRASETDFSGMVFGKFRRRCVAGMAQALVNGSLQAVLDGAAGDDPPVDAEFFVKPEDAKTH
jgi:hypothetical protein